MRLLLTSIAAAAVSLNAGFGAAQDAATYPNRPVTLVVPFAPGGPTDAMARVLTQKLFSACTDAARGVSR